MFAVERIFTACGLMADFPAVAETTRTEFSQ